MATYLQKYQEKPHERMGPCHRLEATAGTSLLNTVWEYGLDPVPEKGCEQETGEV